MDSSLGLDPFFFPSSPLFCGGGGVDTSLDAVAGSSMTIYDEPSILFLAGTDSQQQQQQQAMGPIKNEIESGMILEGAMHQHQQYQPMMVQPQSSPYQSIAPQSTYDWSLATPVHHQSLSDSYRASNSSSGSSSLLTIPHLSDTDSASSGANSEASTPTFVAVHSPQPMAVFSPTPSAASPVSSAASTASHRSMPQQQPSLLDQFECIIPESVCSSSLTNGNSRDMLKVKREKNGKRVSGSKKNSANVVPSVTPVTMPPTNHAALPVFVAAAPMNVNMNMIGQAPRNGGGYASDSSTTQHMSLNNNSNSAHVDLDHDNEPAAGDDEETKRRKLSRKAELARLARKRKKTRLGDLEAEVARLEEELARAKRGRVTIESEIEGDRANAHKMHHAVTAMDQAVQSGLVARTAAMQQAIMNVHHQTSTGNGRTPSLTGSDAVSRSSPTQLTPLIDEFMVAYNATQVACAKHLENMQTHHLKPQRTFEFLAWLMKQPHESSQSIWSSLLGRELHLTPTSREYRELECFRTSMASQHNFDAEIERTFTKMCQLFTKRATQHSKNLNRIRSILDEQQFCKLVSWMNRDANHHQATTNSVPTNAAFPMPSSTAQSAASVSNANIHHQPQQSPMSMNHVNGLPLMFSESNLSTMSMSPVNMFDMNGEFTIKAEVDQAI